jgi:adenylate cyclase
MGDAFMAYWNAPLADPEHAQNACRAALAILRQMELLNGRLAHEAQQSGEPFDPVRIGIGLNSGACCVGNLGSPDRFDYSVIGDAVNVACRLEAATKTYGVPIILGEATAALAPCFALLEIDTVALAGKQRPERIFALLGDEEYAATARFQTLKLVHCELLAALRGKTADEARRSLDGCQAMREPELMPLLAYYERQIGQARALQVRAGSSA